MKRRLSLGWGLLLALPVAGAIAWSGNAPVPKAASDAVSMQGATLRAFGSEAALKAELERLRREERERRRREPPPPPPAPPAPMSSPVAEMAAAPAAGAAAKEESITNTQVAGVDEGGIVKRRGDHLVVLRRGRLFTVRIGGDALKPIASLDAFGPDIDPSGAWYDEMLVSGDTIVVIGYSYQRGGTEIGLFDLDASGGLKYRATYHLRSNDYYSSRNYASRLIGDKLIFYAPLYLNLHGDYTDSLPALRRWLPGADAKGFARILDAKRIYRGYGRLDARSGIALHTVTVCDLAIADMRCRATAVFGAPGQVFHVSEDAAFVWTTPWSRDPRKPTLSEVFRIPLDGGAPSAMRAEGAPVDQLSFLQRDGFLNVLVGSRANGQWMWAPEGDAGQLALMRVPLSMFGDGRKVAKAAHYRSVTGFDAGGGAVQNRFVGDWLLVGAGRSWRGIAPSDDIHAVRYASREPFAAVTIGHAAERFEALGGDGIVIGQSDNDLVFTSLRLGRTAEIAGRYVLPQASQGEQRTHGFFYRPTGQQAGVVGLPVLGGGGDAPGASVLYLHNRALQLSEAGQLKARAGGALADDCRASCIDWYGNARPIFIGERVFALLGYELVEGGFDRDRIRERRRVDFSPGQVVAR
jgi:hypothetical protein